MYFPGHKLNDADLLLIRKSEEERKLMIAEKAQDKPEMYKYNIVLKKAEWGLGSLFLQAFTRAPLDLMDIDGVHLHVINPAATYRTINPFYLRRVW